jgi:hypothetical protein
VLIGKSITAGFSAGEFHAGTSRRAPLSESLLPRPRFGLNWFFAIILAASLPVRAADLVLAGALVSVTHTSISLLLADGRAADALLPDGIAVPYNPGDQVEITCAPVKTVYDAQAGLHYHLLVESLRLVRKATPQERADARALLSWQPGENLLYRQPPVVAQSPSELERVRRVNLEYLSKMPDFVADETARRYWSDSAGKPWRLYDTVEDEIAFTGTQLNHRNIRRNGKPFHRPFRQLGRTVWGGVGFGVELRALFDVKCPTNIDFGGTDTAGGAELLVYLFRSPADGCFTSHNVDRREYNPARTGRLLVDASRGNVVRYREEASGYPENFGLDRATVMQAWDYVKIGGETWLLPVSFEFVGRRSDGNSTRVSVEYRNHRHFEAAASVTFGKNP